MAGERDLEILLKLQDKEALSRLHTALKQVEAETKKSTDSMNLGWAGLASKYYLAQQVLQPVIGFMHDAVTAAMAQEDATNRLNVALQNQGTYSKELSQSLGNMATEFQRSSRFSDDAITGVMQTLVAVGNVGPAQLQKVTQAVMDFSTATGRDLQSSSLMFAKAAEGNTAAFNKMGIKIDEAIPKSQRLAAVLEEVQRKFGGAANADLNTYTGAIAQLGNSWNDFQEELGNLIIKSPAVSTALKDMSADIAEITKAMQENAPAFQGFVDKVVQIGSQTSSGLVGMGDQLRGMFDGLMAAMGGGGTDLGAGIAASLTQSIEAENEAILANQDLLNMQKVEKELTFQEELAGVRQQFNELDFQDKILNEERKIEAQRQQLLAWYDEKSATQMARQQQENEMLAFALDTQKKAHESMWTIAGKARDTFSAGMSAMFVNLLKGTGSVKQAFVDLGWQMVKILVDYLTQLAITWALSKAMQAAGLAATLPIAMGFAAMWAPAATLASLASWGANSAAASAGIIATYGTAKGIALLSAIPGAEEGGNVTSGGSVLVGESGPEILNLPRGASVIPLDRSSGSSVINVFVNIYNPVISSREIADDIAAMIASKVSEIIDVERERL